MEAGQVNMRAFVASLVVALVVLSILGDEGAAPQSVLTGTVARFDRGEWIWVTHASTDPGGVRLALRETTVYEHEEQAILNPETIKKGMRVTVWYRSVGERRPVADKVRVLTGATH